MPWDPDSPGFQFIANSITVQVVDAVAVAVIGSLGIKACPVVEVDFGVKVARIMSLQPNDRQEMKSQEVSLIVASGLKLQANSIIHPVISPSSQMPFRFTSSAQSPPHTPSASTTVPSQSHWPSGMPAPPQIPPRQ